MSALIEAIVAASHSLTSDKEAALLLKYVQTGHKAALAKLEKAGAALSWAPFWTGSLWDQIGSPESLSEEDLRAMRGLVAIAGNKGLGEWFKTHSKERQSPDENLHASFALVFGDGPEAIVEAAAATIDSLGDSLELADGQPNSAGRYLIALSDQQLAEAGKAAGDVERTLAFLLRQAPQRVEKVAESFLHTHNEYTRQPIVDTDCCRLLLEADAQKYEPRVLKAATAEQQLGPKANAWKLLAACNPQAHLAKARELHRALLISTEWATSAIGVAEWLVDTFGEDALPDLISYLRNSTANDYALTAVIRLLADRFGETAAPTLVAALSNPSHGARLDALSYLSNWSVSQYSDVIQRCLEKGLEAPESSDVIRYISAAARWQPNRLEERLWKLFEHKSKPVRQAAARALAKSGDAAVARSGELLTAKKATVRATAVSLLAASDSPAAAAALAAHLDQETDEEVRDQILLALESAWEAQGRKITREEIEARIAGAADKLTQAVVPWLVDSRLPNLFYAGKTREPLSRQAVRYLLYRQSRSKEIRADVEAKALYALVDRGASGDFALAVLQQFFASPMAAEDRWALTVAGLLGDDRAVSALLQQIRKWVESNRGKLAEYATQAVALVGSDVALCAVDSLSIRYRSKQKNIGKAASEAFAEAAERQGISVDELGDRVVPWLGFEPERPRIFDAGGKQIEVRIGQDFKLQLRDIEKNKKIASLPASVPKEVKEEFKELGVTLREVLKGQLLRIENLMVKQHRWTAPRWRELFLAHPVLSPFGCRLIWGLYDEAGQRQATFHALEDRSLTNCDDDSVQLTAAGSVGIVHPLELAPEDRQAWAQHLADYNIQSPFLQLERAVVHCPESDRALRFSAKFKNQEVNGMTFKGRAERLGWQRGSVVDGGGISSYRKCFAGAGADTILEVEGMYIGIDMYATVTLGRFCFVKSGTVTVGSYTYDEPIDEKDERLIAFGDVSKIVYSETLGDLNKIAGAEAQADVAAD